MPKHGNHPIVEHRRYEVARRYLKGMPTAQIATQVNATHSQVTQDLIVLRERWIASSMREFNKAKAHELAKIDNLEHEYWDAWERSCGTRTETTTSKVDSTGKVRLLAAQKVRESDGNPQFLQGVQWCIDKRCKIMGLDSPTRHIYETREMLPKAVAEIASREGLDPVEVRSLAEEYLASMHQK